MDSDYLVTDLDFFDVNGVTFTTEERAVLHNSLTLLKMKAKFHKVYLWGKIMGLQKSYYICYGLNGDILRQKQSFYSLDMKKWNFLTPPYSLQTKLSKQVRKPLFGDSFHDEVVTLPVCSRNVNEGSEAEVPVYLEDSAAEEVDDENSENRQSKELELEDDVQKVLTDEERLASIVEEINFDTVLAPRGAYVRTPLGEVLTNRFFLGLDLNEAAKPHNYMHVRFPKDGVPKNLRVHNSEFSRTIDFLDTIAEDDPKGCWSIQVDSMHDMSILRSLWWPGMVFYHRVCSSDFGFVYVGYGQKNIDLPFML